MFNIGGGEFLIIFLVALVVLGPAKLPEAARQAGKIIGEFRRVSSSFQQEIQSALKDPVSKLTGETTPRSIKDVTSVARVPPLADSSPDTNVAAQKPSSDPFGGETKSSVARSPVAEPAKVDDGPEPNVADTAPIAEVPESDVQAEEDPPDAPVMFGDR